MLAMTPAMLEHAYDLLRVTPPFVRWKLPPSEDVQFHVTSTLTTRGRFFVSGSGIPVIEVSDACSGTLDHLVQVMAHEMVHLYEDVKLGSRCDVEHSAKFKRLAKLVCKHHGWDEKMF